MIFLLKLVIIGLAFVGLCSLYFYWKLFWSQFR
jgi:hypothetical protein